MGLFWIVDDSTVDAQRAKSTLEDLGDVVVFSECGPMIERTAKGETPDVLIMDWTLGDLSGVEACRFLRTQHTQVELPIIMLTVRSSAEDVAEAFTAGATDYVSKPFDPIELRARVSSALTTRQLSRRAKIAEDALATEKERLIESDTRFRRLYESGILGILHMDLAGHIVDANDAFLVMAGISRARVAAGALRMRDITPSEYYAADERAYTALIAHGACPSFEKEIVRPDGERVAVLQAAALMPGRRRAITYLVDVTDRHRLEADRQRLYEAERAARATAESASLMKDEFLAVVSHELRTPLNSILGWANLARTNTKDSELPKRALETIERNARAQAKIIDDILDVSRIISGKVRLEFASADLRSIVAGVVDGMRPTAQAKRVDLVFDARVDAAPIVGDLDRLQQVVWNLIANALKFTDKGSVRVIVGHSKLGFALTVTDTGSGIRPEFLPHVFDRFRQADASTTRLKGGLGLGLSIVRSLTELHGGRVSVTSHGIGHGSTFTVELPAADTVDAADPTPSPSNVSTSLPPPVSARIAGVRVLIVDDQEDAREFAALTLTDHGAIVTAVDSVNAALAFLKRGSEVDIILSDIAMPERDGFELASTLRENGHGARSKLVALSALARPEDIKRALEHGFDAHFSKPIDPPTLVRALHQMMTNGSQVTDDRLAHARE